MSSWSLKDFGRYYVINFMLIVTRALNSTLRWKRLSRNPTTIWQNLIGILIIRRVFHVIRYLFRRSWNSFSLAKMEKGLFPRGELSLYAIFANARTQFTCDLRLYCSPFPTMTTLSVICEICYLHLKFHIKTISSYYNESLDDWWMLKLILIRTA